jgi:hypothetical protein
LRCTARTGQGFDPEAHCAGWRVPPGFNRATHERVTGVTDRAPQPTYIAPSRRDRRRIWGRHMQGANNRFILNKAEWLKRHLMIYDVNAGAPNPYKQEAGNVGTPLPIFEFDLRKIGAIINDDDTTAKEYRLVKMSETIRINGPNRTVGDRTNIIKAYFLPWGPGATYCGKLGIDADFFFTPTLNGCTFAVNGAGPAVSVAHSNFVNPSTQMVDQTLIDNDLKQKFGGTPGACLVKTDYRPQSSGLTDHKAMVIGIREGNDWKFYYQRYTNAYIKDKYVNVGVDLCVPIN